jgi:ssRNA-specific RNase YbeY (16S rRNA maturation enzyme)
METIIKVSPEELDINLLKRIREYIGQKQNVDVTISLKEIDKAYVNALNHSVEQAESDQNLISFTMEEFMTYQPKNKA